MITLTSKSGTKLFSETFRKISHVEGLTLRLKDFLKLWKATKAEVHYKWWHLDLTVTNISPKFVGLDFTDSDMPKVIKTTKTLISPVPKGLVSTNLA